MALTRIGVGGVGQDYGTITDKVEGAAPQPGDLFTRIGVGGVGIYYPVTDKTESEIIPEEIEYPTGGKKYEVMPRRIWIKPDLGEPALRLKDIQPQVAEEILKKEAKVTIEGEPYIVMVGEPPTPKQALRMLPKAVLMKKISEIKADLQVTKRQAREILERVAKKELQKAVELKEELMLIDEELAIIIIMSEV